ncbi:MAG: hypothetical protein ACKO37_08115 [Vampirovibrionales bacterium]
MMMISVPQTLQTTSRVANRLSQLTSGISTARQDAMKAARFKRIPGTGALNILLRGSDAIPTQAQQAIINQGPRQKAFFQTLANTSRHSNFKQAVDGLETNPVKASTLQKVNKLITSQTTTPQQYERAAKLLTHKGQTANVGRGDILKPVALGTGALLATGLAVASTPVVQDNLATQPLLNTPTEKLQTQENRTQVQQFLNQRGVQGEVQSVRRAGDNRLVVGVNTQGNQASSLTEASTNVSTPKLRTVVLQQDALNVAGFRLPPTITGRSTLTTLPTDTESTSSNILKHPTQTSVGNTLLRQGNPLLSSTPPDLSKIQLGFKGNHQQSAEVKLKLPKGAYAYQASTNSPGMEKIFSSPKLNTLKATVLGTADTPSKAVLLTNGVLGKGVGHDNAQVVLKVKSSRGTLETVTIPIQGDIMRPSNNSKQLALSPNAQATVYDSHGKPSIISLEQLNQHLQQGGFEVLTPEQGFDTKLPVTSRKALVSSPGYQADAKARQQYALNEKLSSVPTERVFRDSRVYD